MIFIGDIHARFNYYRDLVKNITHTPTVQVGDFGLGFAHITGHAEPKRIPGDHWFIRGNHDDPAICRAHPNYLGEYGYREDWNLFYCGGADSIDKEQRTIGIDWWPDEEIDYHTLMYKVLPLYEKVCPRFVVTHTCPKVVTKRLQRTLNNGWYNPPTTRTELALQTMFEAYQPDLWVFGHFDHALDVRMDGT